jgi:hypothetical protein
VYSLEASTLYTRPDRVADALVRAAGGNVDSEAGIDDGAGVGATDAVTAVGLVLGVTAALFVGVTAALFVGVTAALFVGVLDGAAPPNTAERPQPENTMSSNPSRPAPPADEAPISRTNTSPLEAGMLTVVGTHVFRVVIVTGPVASCAPLPNRRNSQLRVESVLLEAHVYMVIVQPVPVVIGGKSNAAVRLPSTPMSPKRA